MDVRLSCIIVLASAGLALQLKADYLFTYQDTAGNIVGFSEPTLQPAGQETSFLFDQNGVGSFAFDGVAPAVCGALGALVNGCVELVNSASLGGGIFPNNSFTAPGTFDGSNGAVVDILPYSGFLYTYQDARGNILAFSEPTLQISGNASQFLFATNGITSFTFNGDTRSCGDVGSLIGLGCTQLNNSFAAATIFPAGSFSTPGTYASGGATVNIVPATVTPEPPTFVLLPLSPIAGAVVSRWRKSRAGMA